MNKRTLMVVAVGAAALLVTGALIASNMGFKLNYTLDGPGASASGTNTLGLPFNKMTGLATAKDLIDDINNTGVPASQVTNVQFFNNATDTLQVYDGVSGTDFPLLDGTAFFVKVANSVQYVVVGSHNPALDLTLKGPGSSASGTNLTAVPYHTTAGDALDLINEVNAIQAASVTNVQKYANATDALQVYDGVSGSAFTWVAGEGVFFKMNQDVTWAPAHF